MALVETRERALAAHLHAGLEAIEGLRTLALWPGYPG
jgi:hypothetical protein